MQQSNLQNVIQFELLNKFRTGNPIYDAIISTIIFSTIAGLISRIISLVGGSGILPRFYQFVWYTPTKIMNCFRRKTITETEYCRCAKQQYRYSYYNRRCCRW